MNLTEDRTDQRALKQKTTKELQIPNTLNYPDKISTFGIVAMFVIFNI
jgi:hypothetical protein